MTRSITARLIVLITLSCTLVLAAGMALDYRMSRDEILTRLQQESLDTVNIVVADLENWLEGVEGATRFLGRILEQRDYSERGLEQMLRDIVENNEDIYGAAIALNPARTESPNGFAPYFFHKNNMLSYVDLADVDYRYWEQDWYKQPVAQGKAAWVEPYFDEGGGDTLMTTFSVPIYRLDEAEQRFLFGVVTADVALDDLQQYLKRLRLGKTGFGLMLSKQGVILSANRPEHVMRNLNEVVEGGPDASTWREVFEGSLAGNVVSRELNCPDLTGACIARLSALQTTGWPVGVVYARDELLAPLRDYQLKTAALGLVTLVVLALVITLVSRRLTRPLTALVEVTDQIAHGKLDVPLPRIQSRDEVARLIRAFAEMKRNLRIYIDGLEAETAARSRLEGELTTAREIQMAMLPQGGEAHAQMSGCSLWARVRPAKSVGGDLYTYYHNTTGKLFIALGDVSDKGVPAALFMAKTLSHIQQYSDAFVDPSLGMALLNNALERGNSSCMFVTLFFGVLDPDSGELRFASAGHTAPSLLRDGATKVVHQEDGPALGLASELVYPENRLQLQAGDRLAIYTDGIDEAFSEANQMFGVERFNRELTRTGAHSVPDAGAAIIEAVDDFAGSRPQSDDISLLLLDFNPGSQDSDAGGSHREFKFGPNLNSRVEHWLQGELETLSLPHDTVMELILVSEEIVTNIEKYAGLSGDNHIEVGLTAEPDLIVLEFSDGGIAFNPLQDARGATLGADIESAEIGGLGVHLVSNLTDSQTYQRLEQRNVLRLTKALHQTDNLDTDSEN